jgi:ABC-type Mn2+/Zn2+ transport system permease subunit
MWVVGVILWILFSVVAGTVARNKGRSFAGFFFLSLLISPVIGLIVIALMEPIDEPQGRLLK